MDKYAKSKFKQGAQVKVKGRKGKHRIDQLTIIPMPTIHNGQFILVDTTMYKFNALTKETFYAWEKDCSN